MDFWNRLIGSPSSAPARQPVPVTTPDVRLQNFKRLWLTLQHTWRNGRANDPQLQHNLRNPIRRLTDLLIEEENHSVRLCSNYAYDQQMFIAVSNIAQNGASVVITAAIRFFSTLIDNEENEFLSGPNFAESLTDFLQTTSRKADPSYESEFVEFLFSLATKIRQNPETLPLWFSKRGGYQSEGKSAKQKFAGVTNKEDFPLFYLLLDYVHHDGRVGDFARTGLLYIIESASSSQALERWIVESDLATIMASGLGALYSQLSRKLVIAYPEDDIPAALLFSDFKQEHTNFGAVRSDSSEFRTHLDTFLSYMAFWQDVLEHCRSDEVRQTLLDHFKILFIQQLLYPSLLESSDVDGGSSVAVLTYLRIILEQLDSTDMTHILLSYLLSLPTDPMPNLKADSPSLLKRKQSLDMLSQITEADSAPTPDLYSLVDLILTGLRSKSQPTVASTLRLISAMVRKFHPYVARSVLKTTTLAASPKSRTLGMFNHELELLSELIFRISDEEEEDPTYETYVSDVSVLLETHPCSAHMLAAKLNQRSPSSTLHPASPVIKDHIVRADDPVLLACFKLLESFFSNTVETNLMLTALLIDLASCCTVSLEKWLLMDHSMYQTESANQVDTGDESFASDDGDENPFEEMSDEESDEEEEIAAQLRRILASRKPPTMSTEETDFLKILKTLVDLVENYRSQLPELDARLSERKHAFRFTDSLNDALLNSHGISSGPPRTPSKVRGSGSEFSTPRRAASPAVNANLTPVKQINRNRGRQMMFPETPQTQRARSTSARPGLASPFGAHMVETQIHIKLVNGKDIYNEQKMKPLPSLPVEQANVEGEGEAAGNTSEVLETVPLDEEQATTDLTLSHLLTNIVILQEFLKEFAALLQLRSSLYNDITLAA